jgi:hypothetical protein
MCIGLHVKYPSFLSDFSETSILSTYFLKKAKYEIAGISVEWEPSCSMPTDRQTYVRHDEGNSRYSQCCERP